MPRALDCVPPDAAGTGIVSRTPSIPSTSPIMRLLSFLCLALLSHATAFVAHGPRGARRRPSTLNAAPKKKASKAKGKPEVELEAKAEVKVKVQVKAEPVITKRKGDLIAAVASSTGLSKSDCESCVNALLDTIVEVRSLLDKSCSCSYSFVNSDLHSL